MLKQPASVEACVHSGCVLNVPPLAYVYFSEN